MAIIAAHVPGEQTGNSVVDILYGDVNPSGKLPHTIAFDESAGNSAVVRVWIRAVVLHMYCVYYRNIQKKHQLMWPISAIRSAGLKCRKVRVNHRMLRIGPRIFKYF